MLEPVSRAAQSQGAAHRRDRHSSIPLGEFHPFSDWRLAAQYFFILRLTALRAAADHDDAAPPGARTACGASRVFALGVVRARLLRAVALARRGISPTIASRLAISRRSSAI